MNLYDVARDLGQLPREGAIYVPQGGVTVNGSTLALVVLPGEDPPADWRYLLEVFIAREVVEVWSSWRDSRVPSIGEACEAIVYYADNDAYQED
ncbi:hypothetical protein [Streptomyces sp. SID12488]|uniref:hypothetical protein n=1 Tax=Streptomyces sp. SID12488 TaxID=2706040 RepID=UPI0013DAD580|nr:hypothetical protein [Streptomyces sp. SID12488]NEA65613.1 hypothetical protein [Streptomyces sp. SID12488]